MNKWLPRRDIWWILYIIHASRCGYKHVTICSKVPISYCLLSLGHPEATSMNGQFNCRRTLQDLYDTNWYAYLRISLHYLFKTFIVYALFLQLSRPVPSFPAQIRQPFSHLCLHSASVSPVLQNLQPAWIKCTC